MQVFHRFWSGELSDSFKDYARARILTRDSAALSALAALLLGGVLCFALWQVGKDPNIWFWLTALYLCVVGGFILRTRQITRQTLSAVFTVDILMGFLWLIAVLVFFPTAPDGLQIFFALVVLGAALCAAIFQSNFLPACAATIGLALPAIAVRYFLQAGEEKLFLPIFLLVGWLVALGLAWSLHRAFLSRTTLQFEKNILLQSVENKIAELDQLRKKEQAARQDADSANAAKSRFLAHASHDLRQPLHAVGLLLATISDKGQSKQTKKVLSRVSQSLDVLSDLFDSLLDVALLDTGQVDVNISVFPVNDILQNVVQDFESTAKRNGVSLRICPSSLLLNSDPVIVRRMVQNLVSNAIAHAHNSRVLVGVRRQKNTIRIEVHDTGEGIASEDQKRIFEEFTKVGTRKPKNDMPGLGLGLAIVQRLANIVKAHISLKSTLGTGSVFCIENLTRAEARTMPSGSALMENKAQVQQTARIAILDDDMEILQATESLVTKWGFVADIYTAYDPATLRLPDIILCDYELMQPLNGVEVIAAIRTNFDRKIPAILITGNNSKELILQAKAQDLPILFKPVKPVQLRSVLLTALSDDS